ncbi:MSHA biogenesis protein MshK [Undibacterium sp. FT137W]|uniref:MSHA biogenesis protein MshK n=2 Tax=Undibacterium fentianense TaxID=2828728 RepID=A0A941E2W6_9BURK|nr:MSHA biogenesis protein MshK [Undibacterium fentianense]
MQELSDPTRPPNRVLQSGMGLTVASGPILQSILISANRKLAIIDGKAVRLNGKFGDQTLIRMTENEVVLKRGKQLQTLSLHPDLSKKPVTGILKNN